MNVLVGGCSFSESKKPFNQKSWTDLLSDEINLNNLAKSHNGQSRIVLSVIEELVSKNFNYDLVIIQLSAFGRGFAIDEKDFIKRILKDDLVEFAPYIHEYTNNNLSTGRITNNNTKVFNEFSKHSLFQIYMLKKILDFNKVNYLMFYGWNQIDSEIFKNNKQVINEIHNSPNFWMWNEFGGMLDFVINTMGKIGIEEDDFHLNDIGNEYFYKEVILPTILKYKKDNII